jgi:hypothetical protein
MAFVCISIRLSKEGIEFKSASTSSDKLKSISLDKNS